MAMSEKIRVRRTPEDARQLILASAERLLVSGGVQAVQMRSVARESGITDAGVAHHFGSLNGLLEALIEHGAARVRLAISEAVAEWISETPQVGSLIKRISEVYESGYAELALQLHQSGWKSKGNTLLEPVFDALKSISKNPGLTDDELRSAIASLHLWLALDPLFGAEFRLSSGLRGTKGRIVQMQWWEQTFERMLGLAPSLKLR